MSNYPNGQDADADFIRSAIERQSAVNPIKKRKPPSPQRGGYAFGPIVDQARGIIAFILTLIQPLPQEVDDLIGKLLGEATVGDDTYRLWKLAEAIPNDDEWQWLIRALEWEAGSTIGWDIDFEALAYGDSYVEAVNEMDGPDLDFYGTRAIVKLIARYREFRATDTRSDVADKPQGNGFQRLLYRAWAIRDENLKPVDRLTLFAILRYCWSRDSVEVSETALAADIGASVRTLQRSLSLLSSHKYIAITLHHNHNSTYRILKKELIPPYAKHKRGRN